MWSSHSDLSDLNGPVAITGGETGADRSLINGVMLPGELDALFLPIELPPFESRQIDLVGIYNTADAVDDSGVLTETALNGFGIATDLDFGAGAVGNPFGEAQIFAGGVTFGTISFAAGAFSTDPINSTIEILNVLLGSGNDTLDIQGSLQADLTAEITAPDVLVDRAATPFTVAAVAGGVTLTGPAWAAQGFRVGQLVYVDQGSQDSNATPLAAWRILDITGPGDTVMELEGAGIFGAASRVFVSGRHGGLTVVHGGGGDDTIVVCNPAGGVPCGAVGGPESPLVVYGDTSQDGAWYSGDPALVDGFDFGLKPFDQFAGLRLPNANNEDNEWFLGQGNTFATSGNDMIDARGLFAGVACDLTTCDLPTVGFTAYGGAGDDTIYGSQTGDHLAGGSGNDEIHGGRGVDHIYGDSGFNVDVFTRGLKVVVVNVSIEDNADNLAVGDDNLFGEGDGTALDQTVLGGPADVYDDFIAADHGIFSQDTEDTNSPLPLLQKIQTTLRVTQAITAVFGEGGNDTIFDDLGADTVLGGLGDDRIETGVDDDIVIGDNGIVVFDLIGTDALSVAHEISSLASTLGGDDVILVGEDDDVVIAGEGKDLVGYVPIGDPLSDPANNVNANGGPAEPTQVEQDTGDDIVIGDNGYILFNTDTGTRIKTFIQTGDATVTLVPDLDPVFAVGLPVAGDDDFIFTDEGDDIVFGTSGNDWVDTGTTGNDLVVGDHGAAIFALFPVGSPTKSVLTIVGSIAPSVGGDDVLLTGGDDDVVIGGFGKDLVNYVPVDAVASDPTNNTNANGGPAEPTQVGAFDEGDDIVFGDNGFGAFDTSTGMPLPVGLLTTAPAEGDADFIYTGDAGNDVVLAGVNGLAGGVDWVDTGSTGNDIVIGDLGEINYDLVDIGAGLMSVLRLVTADLVNAALGGDDVLLTGDDDDVVIAGAGNDLVNYVPVDAVASDPTNNTNVNGGPAEPTQVGVDAGNDIVIGDIGLALFETLVGRSLVTEVRTAVPTVAGDDFIFTDEGDDIVLAGSGKDWVDTGVVGNDIVAGDNAVATFNRENTGADRVSVLALFNSLDVTIGDDDVLLVADGDDVVIAGFGKDLVNYVPVNAVASDPVNNNNANGGDPEPTQVGGADNGNDVVLGDQGVIRFDTSIEKPLLVKIETTNHW